MKDLVREVMEDGAAGIQTGLEYYPSAHANVAELVEVCKVVAEYGGVHGSHLRGYGVGFRESAGELFATAEQAGVPVHMAHLAGCRYFVPVLEEARRKGLDVSFDAYPYMAGCTHLIYCFPAWVQHGTPAEVLARLADPALRDKIRPEMNTFFSDRDFELKDVVFSNVATDESQSLLGLSLDQAVESSGKDLTDFACDLLVKERLGVLMIFHWHDENRLKTGLTHPLHMMSSDGVFRRGRPHPRGYGAFPRLLGHFARDRKWLTLEDAVRKMTGYPAARFRLNDRGLVRPGMAADIVVFDPETVIDRSTYEDGRRYAEGVEYVAVNGQLVLDGGKMTGLKPGRVVRAR
jgi:N-acyl-D-amino-acid deacylase